jgi:hypothetical protein
MREGSRLVLQLLADGRISIDEAYDLLDALNGGPAAAAEEAAPRQQSQSGATGWSWDQLGLPFSTLSPADMLALLFQGLSSEWQRRGVNYD